MPLSLLAESLTWTRESTMLRPQDSERKQTAGFTLVEILVTVTLISAGILVLGGLMMQSARTATAASAVAYQTTELSSEIARLDALPFANLAVGTTCDTVVASQLPRIRCSTIATVNTKTKRVTVTVTPTGSHAPPAQSVVFERTISGFGNPLNTP
jgi:prepilin-type N-terminal cleavage/methylation domain-containing protein